MPTFFTRNRITHFAILTCIVIIAIAARSYAITTVPVGIYPDEANNATNAIDAIISDTYLWFYPDNNGREGLFLNLIALSFMLFGINIAALKIPAILMGVLTVCGVYMLARELFISKPRIALIASYLTAVSFWAINFSRIAFRANMMLPILTFAFFFFLHGVRTMRRSSFIYAGLLFGLGFHTYIAYRIAPLLFLALLMFFIVQEGASFVRIFWKNILLFCACALITMFPMLYTFQQHPEYLQSRSADISVFAQNEKPLFNILSETITSSLLKYNVFGDQNWRHGYPPLPTLEPFVGVMFLCGLLTSSFYALRFLYLRITQKSRNRKFVMHMFMITWFIGLLAPEFMTTEGLPHSLRSLGTLPIVFIFAGSFIDTLLAVAQRRSYHIYVITSLLTVTFLIYTGIFGILQYHVVWANNPAHAQAFNKNLTDIASYIHTIPTDRNIYVIAGTMERLPIRFLTTQNANVHFVYPEQTGLIKNADMIILPHEDHAVIERLHAQFDFALQKIDQPLNSSFFVIYPLSQ